VSDPQVGSSLFQQLTAVFDAFGTLLGSDTRLTPIVTPIAPIGSDTRLTPIAPIARESLADAGQPEDHGAHGGV